MADQPFSHLDDSGTARMVDVSGKAVTRRVAEASCRVHLPGDVVDRLDQMPKGDALVVAQLAGIQGAKRASELVPLAHPLPLEEVHLDLEPTSEEAGAGWTGIAIRSRVVVTAKTGAEMEALYACAGAALALYDMVKAVSRECVITDLRLEHKSGGRTGVWHRGAEAGRAAEDPGYPGPEDGLEGVEGVDGVDGVDEADAS